MLENQRKAGGFVEVPVLFNWVWFYECPSNSYFIGITSMVYLGYI